MPDPEELRTLVLVALGVTIAYWFGWVFGHQFGSRGWSGPVEAIQSKTATWRAGWAAGFLTGRRTGRRLTSDRQRRRQPEGIKSQ
jgi:hypothetical protein